MKNLWTLVIFSKSKYMSVASLGLTQADVNALDTMQSSFANLVNMGIIGTANINSGDSYLLSYVFPAPSAGKTDGVVLIVPNSPPVQCMVNPQVFVTISVRIIRNGTVVYTQIDTEATQELDRITSSLLCTYRAGDRIDIRCETSGGGDWLIASGNFRAIFLS
jgi:uncharacterized membrane protein YhdT